MRVVVFDIDGTLTDTTQVDSEVFRSVLSEVVPELGPVGSLGDFPELTDTAILRELFDRAKLPGYERLEPEVRASFVNGLMEVFHADPGLCLPIPGAEELFDRMREGGWTPAVATGGWRESAELKLEVAGIPTGGVPLSTSSERTRRTEIIELAVEEATASAGASRVIYVGDGPWDVKACRDLGIGFIGRASPSDFDRLAALGAQTFVTDFTDSAQLLRLLSIAAPISTPGNEV